MGKITLHDVIDVRTGKYHHTVIVRERDRKWFVPASEADE